MEPTANPTRRPGRLARWRTRFAVLATVVASVVAGTATAAAADPGTCGCPIVWPPRPVTYAPCAQLGPIDWLYRNSVPPTGVRYINVSATPVLDVAHSRFVENPTSETIDGNWTASQALMVTITSSFTLTLQGGPADPAVLAGTVSLATGIQAAVSHTTTVGVGATAAVPPHSGVLGEYGLRSHDVVMDVQRVWSQDRVTCGYYADERMRHTAHVPTVQEGWRFTRI